jgi:hypothetical protein
MLTDPIIDGDIGILNDIKVRFEYPVYQVNLYVIDIDNQETFILKAFNDELGLVDSMTRSYSDVGTGDEIATLMIVEAIDIDYIVVDSSQPGPPGGGYAIDDLEYKSTCDDDEDTYIDESCGGDDCDDEDPLVGPPGPCGCGASAAASTLGAGTVHGSRNLAKHLAYLLLPIGAVIGMRSWRRKR